MNFTVAGEGAVVGVTADRAGEDFALWVGPHLTAMARLAGRLVPSADRDEVVQEALIRAWRRRSTYDDARGGVATWLLAIVASCAHRSRVRAPREQLDGVADTRRTAAGPDHDIDLERALRALPKRERLAVALYYFVGLDIAETAAVMVCSAGTVKATLYHARARLRDQLGGGR
jgi:RNA polymerase sigma-70 factor (ECF subfamily)